MPQAVDNIALALEQLSAQLRSIEDRVAALETQSVILSGASASRSEALAESKDPCPVGNSPALEALSSETRLQRPRPPATWRGFPPLETPSGAVPILGKAVLGIAGAYLLRAIAESSFHHLVDYNWDTSRGCPSFLAEPPGEQIRRDPARLADIKTYVSNVAQWLLPVV